MNDRLVLAVSRAVAQYTMENAGAALDYCHPQHFANMVGHVRSVVPGLSKVADAEVGVVAAMCWLGPDSEGVPPTDMRESLLEIIEGLEPDPEKRLERVMEFAIAYGCGKWRKAGTTGDPWKKRWPGAVLALGRAIVPAIRKVRKKDGKVSWEAGHRGASGDTNRLWMFE